MRAFLLLYYLTGIIVTLLALLAYDLLASIEQKKHKKEDKQTPYDDLYFVFYSKDNFMCAHHLRQGDCISPYGTKNPLDAIEISKPSPREEIC